MCALRLEPRSVSGQHAVITWHEDGWRVRDLGSRNGTFFDGRRLEPGVAVRCLQGSLLGFGTSAEEWELVDPGPPVPMLVPVKGGAALLMERGILPIPSPDRPLGSIHQGSHGGWLIELDESVEEIGDGDVLEVGGDSYRFHVPQIWVGTESFGEQPLSLETAQLCFRVSRDEETVELDLVCRGKTTPLGQRSAFYLLLTLARIRLAQRDEESQGWVHWSELATMLRAQQSDINLWVHRIRERFAEVGVARPGAVVERRSGTGQLRIGSENIAIDGMSGREVTRGVQLGARGARGRRPPCR